MTLCSVISFSHTERNVFKSLRRASKKIQVLFHYFLVAFLPPDETTDYYQVSGVPKNVVGFLASNVLIYKTKILPFSSDSTFLLCLQNLNVILRFVTFLLFKNVLHFYIDHSCSQKQYVFFYTACPNILIFPS